MNRFRSKKKGKDGDGSNRPSLEDAPPVPKVSKTFKRKKQEPEEKVEIDLSNALPSTDDFRTSLLMNGLSARFSMLREQDDPNSKIGKASDDSVLFPTKRQSRLNGYNFQLQGAQGLSDIAEVSSINGSIRPPFARQSDGYGTDDDTSYSGSIMSRPKPGEGNNLFGGRQKIYKLASGSAGATRGRALYDDDVSLSAFQKLRQQEKEQQEQEEREQELEQQHDLDDLDGNQSVQSSSRPGSPTLPGYNRKRETSSTTSSGGPSNARMSTAATSITSQRTPSLNGSHTPISPNTTSAPSIDKSAAKGRRLYDTGLDQHLHEQQHSAMNRIDHLARRNIGAQTPPNGFVSPTELYQNRDVFNRPQVAGKASMPNLRTASPTVAGSGLGLGPKPSNIDTKPARAIVSPPLSPGRGEIEEHPLLRVQPNDRGKATALGAFQKPAQSYDENKYAQRQLQMQQGRATPTERSRSPPRGFGARQPTLELSHEESSRSRSNSAQRQFLSHGRTTESPSPLGDRLSSEPEVNAAGTFLSSPNESLVDVTRSDGREDSARSPHVALERPPESEHPANRQKSFDQYNSREDGGNGTGQSSSTFTPELNTDNSKPDEKAPIDSPTLGPTTGLSGMVRQHLRAASNASSIYGNESSPGFDSKFPQDTSESLGGNDYASVSNTWVGEDWDDEYYDEKKFSLDNIVSGSTKKENQSEQPEWEKELASHHQRTFSSDTQKERIEFHNELAERRRRVQENLKSFVENETAKSGRSSTSADWVRDGNLQQKSATREVLKQKPSLGSLGKQKESGKAMKMLGLGNATITTGTSPNRQKFDESGKEEDADALQNNTKPGIAPPKAFTQARRDAQRAKEQESRLRHTPGRSALAPVNGHLPHANLQSSEWVKSENGWSRVKPLENLQRKAPTTWVDDVPPSFQPHTARSPSRERKPPPLTGATRNKNGANSSSSRSPPRSMARDRSGSDRHREAMGESTSSLTLGVNDEHPATRPPARSPITPGGQFQPSPSFPPVNAPSGRSRSNSKSPVSGHLDGNSLQPINTGAPMDNDISPRPSPVAPFVLNPTPPQVPSGSTAEVRVPTGRKKSVNKYEISEPTLISSTFRVSTVNLPPGSSLKNGAEAPPPVPPVNPRRRQTRTMFGAFGKKDDGSYPMPSPSFDDVSTFSADEAEHPSVARQNLRHISSEGAGLNGRVHSEAPASGMPSYPPPNRSPPRTVDGGMF
ncbi:hypothetical protein F5884DRAFT_374480 [Xylogone sp. PMI_703]|nr:hypothetical protein F5884DRAFT_374480 [Xylogone sp. PMI_703]